MTLQHSSVVGFQMATRLIAAAEVYIPSTTFLADASFAEQLSQHFRTNAQAVIDDLTLGGKTAPFPALFAWHNTFVHPPGSPSFQIPTVEAAFEVYIATPGPVTLQGYFTSLADAAADSLAFVNSDRWTPEKRTLQHMLDVIPTHYFSRLSSVWNQWQGRINGLNKRGRALLYRVAELPPVTPKGRWTSYVGAIERHERVLQRGREIGRREAPYFLTLQSALLDRVTSWTKTMQSWARGTADLEAFALALQQPPRFPFLNHLLSALWVHQALRHVAVGDHAGAFASYTEAGNLLGGSTHVDPRSFLFHQWAEEMDAALGDRFAESALDERFFEGEVDETAQGYASSGNQLDMLYAQHRAAHRLRIKGKLK